MIEFKTKRQAEEFRYLHPGLQKILYWLSGWTEMNTAAKQITITGLIRTQEEQNAIYADNVLFRESPWPSVHQFGRGADISVLGFLSSGDDPASICVEVNREFLYGDGRHSTAIYHEVNRHGKHIHIQVRA